MPGLGEGGTQLLQLQLTQCGPCEVTHPHRAEDIGGAAAVRVVHVCV